MDCEKPPSDSPSATEHLHACSMEHGAPAKKEKTTWPIRGPIWGHMPMTPPKYVFYVIFIGQRSSPWSCNSVKVEIKFHLDCKLHFPSAQSMLRQMHLRNVSESTEAMYRVSWLRFEV